MLVVDALGLKQIFRARGDDQLPKQQANLQVHVAASHAVQSRRQSRSAGRLCHRLSEYDNYSSSLPLRALGDCHGLQHRDGWVHLSQGPVLSNRRERERCRQAETDQGGRD